MTAAQAPLVVAMAATAGAARSMAPLVALVGAGHRIVSWHRSAGTTVDVVIATDPDVVGPVTALGGAGAPAPAVACRVDTPGDVELAAGAGVRSSFTGRAELAAVGGAGRPPVHFVPDAGLDLERYAVLPPLTRSRIRASLDLPAQLVLAVGRSASRVDRTTGLALATAAVVDGDLLPLAMALGTPVVTDAASAHRLGLRDGVEVVVTPTPAEADGLAAALARDDDRCAAQSRHARAFAERHLDLGGPVRRLRRELGLEPEPALVDLRLDELVTPPSSRLRQRTHAALSLFTMEPLR